MATTDVITLPTLFYGIDVQIEDNRYWLTCAGCMADREYTAMPSDEQIAVFAAAHFRTCGD